MLIDTHAHLDSDDFRGEINALLQRAAGAGIDTIVTVGTDIKSSYAAVELAGKYSSLFASAGCHPHEADRVVCDTVASEIRSLAQNPRVVAVGECGLDYFKNFSGFENQRGLFRLHIRLANELGKPLIIHCRDAYRDCIEILREESAGTVKGVAHCFSGSAEEAKLFLDLGLYISIAGPVTYPKADRLREVVKTIPLDRLLVETDAPYLAPQARRGKRNEPSYVRETAEKVAEVRGLSLTALAEATSANARALFFSGR